MVNPKATDTEAYFKMKIESLNKNLFQQVTTPEALAIVNFDLNISRPSYLEEVNPPTQDMTSLLASSTAIIVQITGLNLQTEI